MALGQYGTTLLDELNRLANGGTYRAPGAMVDEARAAKQWAAQRSVSTNLTDTVGVLNAIAGTTTTCLLYTSPSPRDRQKSRMPSSA